LGRIFRRLSLKELERHQPSRAFLPQSAKNSFVQPVFLFMNTGSNFMVIEEQYVKHTVISNITPGVLAAAYAVTLPGVLATRLILSLFSLAGEEAQSMLLNGCR